MAISPAATQYLADLLSGIGQGFLQAPRGGSPFAGLGIGIQNANQLMGQRRQIADQDQERAWRTAQIERQKKMDAEADAARAQSKSGLSRLLGQPDPTATPKFVGGTGSSQASFQQPGPTTAPPAWLTPERAAVLQSMPPDQALNIAAQWSFKEPAAPDLTEFYNPDGTAYKGYLDPKTNQPVQIGNAYPRWQPPQPKGPSEMKQRAIEAGLTPGTPEYRNFMLTGGTAPKTKMVDLTPDEIKARGLPIGTVAQLNPDTNELEIKNKGAEGPGGMFDTKSIPGQALNFLAAHQEDPSSLEYAIAYAVASKPTTQFLPDGTVNTFTPDVSMFKKAAFSGPQAQVDAAAASLVPAAPPQPAATPPTSATPQPAATPPPAEQPNPNIQTQEIPGGTVSRVQGGYQTPADIQKLKEINSEVGSIRSSLNNFKKVVDGASMTDFMDAATGGHFEGGKNLNSAWAAAALQTKAEALFNLGVLNGPDLPLIQRVLTDPSTVGGAISSKKAYAAGIDQVLNLIDERVAAFEAQYGKKEPNAPAAPPAAQGATIDALKNKYGITPVAP